MYVQLYSLIGQFKHKILYRKIVLEDTDMATNRRKKDKNRPASTVRERIADSFEVSKELTLDVVKITLIGAREITIENYIGVIEYTDKIIHLSAKPSPLKINGDFLEIKTMTKEMLYVSGVIHKIGFEN